MNKNKPPSWWKVRLNILLRRDVHYTLSPPGGKVTHSSAYCWTHEESPEALVFCTKAAALFRVPCGCRIDNLDGLRKEMEAAIHETA